MQPGPPGHDTIAPVRTEPPTPPCDAQEQERTDQAPAPVSADGSDRARSANPPPAALASVYATSLTGYPLKPFNWQEMVCTQSGIREWRKVAKPSVDVE